jgi:hypothetical protein
MFFQCRKALWFAAFQTQLGAAKSLPRAGLPATTADVRSTCESAEPRETAPARSRMLKQGPCWSPIEACSFVKAVLEKTALLCSGNSRRFPRQGPRIINKLSLHEPVTGNLNSLLSRKNSLFFLGLDDLLLLPKRCKLCSMPCGALRE